MRLFLIVKEVTNSVKITNAILFMIVKDSQPFMMVENEGFKNLMKTIAPHYKISSRYTIKRQFESKYNVISELFKQKLASINLCSLTTDIWTDTIQTRSFLGVTVHFIKNVNIYSITLGVYELSERHTAEYIAEN